MSCIVRPEITDDRISQIREMIQANPGWNRTKISRQVCMLWGWQNPNGQLKDISCRDMLRELDKAGSIELPPRMSPSRSKGSADKVVDIEHDTTPISAKLVELQPLNINTIKAGKSLAQFKSLVNQYHYLGYDRSIGENMKYMVYERSGRPIACLMFGSAAWSCRDRDNYIGWNKSERAQGLRFLTNNTRYLIHPWVFSPHLASHVLSLVLRRISDDWMQKYGHPLHCVETFVETGRFKGTCYKAANWVKVGTTTGRGRDGGHHNAVVPLKDIYLYPLTTKFKEALRAPEKWSDDKWA